MTDRFFGRHTIIGEDGTAYMTRYWLGRLRLHVFTRGDQDRDPHDHPWGFWTFPLTSYVEEVTLPNRYEGEPDFETHRQVVRRFRWHYRPATHTHRVLGYWNGRHERPSPWRLEGSETVDSYDARGRIRPTEGYTPSFRTGTIVTIVWHEKGSRKWGFLKHRDGRWCWVHWREYVTGRDAPCE
jgi:hypothetical protein